MALPNIQFIKSTSGLGRPLTGTDYISGYIHYYNGTLPSGFSSTDRIKKIFSLDDAVALGITNTGLGAIASQGIFEVTDAGTEGDTVKYTCNTIEGAKVGTPVTLASFTLTASDVVSTSTAATALTNAINSGTNIHGFTAEAFAAVVLITAPKTEGVFLNGGTPYAITVTGTFDGTITQNDTAGTASYIDIAYYHISEYFRIQPKGQLYIGFYEEEMTYSFNDITTMQNFANGEIKQMGVYQKNYVFYEGQCTALQAIADANEAVYKPLQFVLNGEISDYGSIASLPDLTTVNAPNVSVCIAQDGYAAGYKLWKATGLSIGSVGTMLGAISFGAVSDSIAWIQKFPMSNGVEYDTLAFANGQSYTAISDSQLESLNNYAYTFLLKQIGITGSYWSNSLTAITPTSDYSTIENNRVYQKITRVVRAALLPSLSSPLKVNADGTLTAATIGYFETLCQNPLTQMEADNELSAHKVIINPNQNVLATSTLEITLQNVPLGVARVIKVNVGFVKSV